MLISDIVDLAAVIRKIIELPFDRISSVVICDQLPLAPPHRGMGLVLPKKMTIRHLLRRILQIGNHTGALKSLTRFPLKICWVFNASNIQQGRHDVDKVKIRLGRDRPCACYSIRPMGYQGRSDPPFMSEFLKLAKR